MIDEMGIGSSQKLSDIRTLHKQSPRLVRSLRFLGRLGKVALTYNFELRFEFVKFTIDMVETAHYNSWLKSVSY